MPKYYCANNPLHLKLSNCLPAKDYCDVYLTHVRKAHNNGKNHIMNVRNYYAELGQDKAQAIIDEITKAYERVGQSGFPPQYGYPPGAAPPVAATAVIPGPPFSGPPPAMILGRPPTSGAPGTTGAPGIVSSGPPPGMSGPPPGMGMPPGLAPPSMMRPPMVITTPGAHSNYPTMPPSPTQSYTGAGGPQNSSIYMRSQLVGQYSGPTGIPPSQYISATGIGGPPVPIKAESPTSPYQQSYPVAPSNQYHHPPPLAPTGGNQQPISMIRGIKRQAED
ncbi:hypothetical protein G9A89_021484 [Geosiphon pyriformis]|nr:hypothetical protein G9A89_021484 [Geosiphon pyriformis]